MAGIPLFIAPPAGTCRLALRRFRYGDPGDGHRHDVTVVVGDDEPCTPRTGDGRKPVSEDRIPHDDPRWPEACDCGELFTAEDQWQVSEREWYEGGGQRFAWGIGSWDGPPGAMIRAAWRDREDRPEAWVIFLPNGEFWCTNDRASRGAGTELGPYWTVTGTAPDLTVHPSINDTGAKPWHGWIRDGELAPA